jgi:ribose-phosphate pyrophosphokinase
LATITVLAGPASVDLASRISKELKADLVVPELRVFTDGESKLRFPKVDGTCVIVQSTYPPADTHVLQVMMMAKKCIDDGASEVCAVVPYLAYARQDRPFLEGESATISLIANLLAASGVTSVVTVDMHSQLGMSHFTTVGITSVSSIPLLAEYAEGMNLHEPVAVSPDAGGAERVRQFAGHLKSDILILKKSRNRSTGEVTIEDPEMSVKGRDVVLVDDMISSGGSIIAATHVLRRKGAARVYAMCAHALLLGDASKNIAGAGVDDIIATNSIPNEHAKVDLSRSIADVLRKRYTPGSA